jgi:hypothetical protein
MMEISKQQIQAELLPLSDKANVLYQRLMTEQGYMRDSLGKVQHYFSDQEVGQAVIAELSQAMRELQCAYSELEQLKGAVIEFTRVLSN